jgi:hypothetical protein
MPKPTATYSYIGDYSGTGAAGDVGSDGGARAVGTHDGAHEGAPLATPDVGADWHYARTKERLQYAGFVREGMRQRHGRWRL